MKIRFFKKAEVRKNTEIFEDMMNETGKMIDGIFRVTGTSYADLLSDLDEESGAALGIATQSMKKLMDLAYESVERADKMEEKFEELQKKTDALLANNQILIGMVKKLQDAQN